MNPETFWNMRPCDFGLVIRGYRNKRHYEYERGWIYTREVIATLCNVNRDSRSSAIRGRDVIPLSFDPPLVIHYLTDEENESIQARLKKALEDLPPGHPLRK